MNCHCKVMLELKVPPENAGAVHRGVEAGEIFTETRGTQICEFLLLASWCWHQSIGGGWGGFSHGKALVGCP